MKVAALLAILAGLAGCGTVKEVSAPCKRPANLTSYAEDVEPRHDCGPMRAINGDDAAVDAILVILEGAI